MREIADIVRLYERDSSDPFAFASLVEVEGSSYRRPGARMLISSQGKTAGNLSGGCLEEEVRERALRVLETGQHSLMSFDTRRRFGCAGVIQIYVEKAQRGFLKDLSHGFHERRPSWLATVFREGKRNPGTHLFSRPEECPSPAFVQPLIPEIRLILIGEGPGSMAVKLFAQTLGWQIQAVASASEIAGSCDAWTAALIETHNYGKDFAALRALADHPLPYVGLVGSRRRRDQLLADLLDAGAGTLQNLYAPAGLDLGSESPEEIALAIVAEVQAVFSKITARHLRDQAAPLHPRGGQPRERIALHRP